MDGIKEEMNFEIHKLLQVIKDPVTGEVIDSITEPVALIKVTQVKDTSATCSIVEKLRFQYIRTKAPPILIVS